MSERPVGVIVAGGRALRMGGGDKTLMRLAGRPVLAWLLDRLAPQCAALALSANGPPQRFAGFGLPVLPDAPDDRDRGPLAGVLAGLDWAARDHPAAPALLTVPGDVPWPPPDLAARLGAAASSGRAAAARSAGRRHPLVALWPVDRRREVATVLREEGNGRVVAALDRLGVAWVDWPVAPVDPFANLNTPADLDEQARVAPHHLALRALGDSVTTSADSGSGTHDPSKNDPDHQGRRREIE